MKMMLKMMMMMMLNVEIFFQYSIMPNAFHLSITTLRMQLIKIYVQCSVQHSFLLTILSHRLLSIHNYYDDADDDADDADKAYDADNTDKADHADNKKLNGNEIYQDDDDDAWDDAHDDVHDG